MDARAEWVREEPVGTVVSRLVEEGRTYLHAEVDLYKAIARRRAEKAGGGLIRMAIGAVMLWFAGTALLLGIVLGLATLIGPLAAGAAVALLFAIGGYLLLWSGAPGLRALAGDEEERAAREGKEYKNER